MVLAVGRETCEVVRLPNILGAADEAAGMLPNIPAPVVLAGTPNVTVLDDATGAAGRAAVEAVVVVVEEPNPLNEAPGRLKPLLADVEEGALNWKPAAADGAALAAAEKVNIPAVLTVDGAGADTAATGVTEGSEAGNTAGVSAVGAAGVDDVNEKPPSAGAVVAATEGIAVLAGKVKVGAGMDAAGCEVALSGALLITTEVGVCVFRPPKVN